MRSELAEQCYVSNRNRNRQSDKGSAKKSQSNASRSTALHHIHLGYSSWNWSIKQSNWFCHKHSIALFATRTQCWGDGEHWDSVSSVLLQLWNLHQFRVSSQSSQGQRMDITFIEVSFGTVYSQHTWMIRIVHLSYWNMLSQDLWYLVLWYILEALEVHLID